MLYVRVLYERFPCYAVSSLLFIMGWVGSKVLNLHWVGLGWVGSQEMNPRATLSCSTPGNNKVQQDVTLPVPCTACQCRENQEAVALHKLLDSRRSRSQTAVDRRCRPVGCCPSTTQLPCPCLPRSVKPSLPSASNRT